jgi:hypothetical protein
MSQSSSNGYATIQNLMSALDNITLDNGNLPPAPITSSADAASGYSVVQNLLTNLDHITLGNVPAAAASGASALQNVDSIIATPLPISVTA